MKRSLPLILLVLFSAQLLAQPLTNSATQVQIGQYYKLAVQYKDGNGVPMDYAKAVGYFQQAADLGDAQSEYALGYMHYKGLGCEQDYGIAARMFAKGAFAGRDNSIYFYALCWRNGYGLQKNEDSALYWLRKDSAIGYRLAVNELATKQPENGNDAAKALVTNISNAAMPVQTTANKFERIENRLPAADVVAGYYTGYLVQYDWSGQNVVSGKQLHLTLTQESGLLHGTWAEEGTDSVLLEARMSDDSIRFIDTKYKRKDHYSPDSAIVYEFKGAALNIVQKDDSIFLAGNVGMFSAMRGEPSKPLLVALYRTDKKLLDNGPAFRASPSPFTSILNVEFTLPVAASVEVQLISISGQTAYRNMAGNLQSGHYLLPLQAGYISPGIYIVRLLYGGKSATAKVLKQ